MRRAGYKRTKAGISDSRAYPHGACTSALAIQGTMRKIAVTAFLVAVFFAGDCNTGLDFSSLDQERSNLPVELSASVGDVSSDSIDGLLRLDFAITPPRPFEIEWGGHNADRELIVYGKRRYPDLHKTTGLEDTTRVSIHVAFNRSEPFSLISYIHSFYRAAKDTFIWMDCPLADPPRYRGMCAAQWIYGDKVR